MSRHGGGPYPFLFESSDEEPRPTPRRYPFLPECSSDDEVGGGRVEPPAGRAAGSSGRVEPPASRAAGSSSGAMAAAASSRRAADPAAAEEEEESDSELTTSESERAAKRARFGPGFDRLVLAIEEAKTEAAGLPIDFGFLGDDAAVRRQLDVEYVFDNIAATVTCDKCQYFYVGATVLPGRRWRGAPASEDRGAMEGHHRKYRKMVLVGARHGAAGGSLEADMISRSKDRWGGRCLNVRRDAAGLPRTGAIFVYVCLV